MNLVRLPFLLKLSLAVISIIGVGYLIHLGQGILAPFFLAFLMAMLFLPFATFLENVLRFPRSLSTMCSALALLVMIGGVFYFFATEISLFAKDAPKLGEQFTHVFTNFQHWISRTFDVKVDEQFDYIDKGLNKLLSSTGLILGFTIGIFSRGLGFLVFFILFFTFILNYRRLLNGFIIGVFGEQHQASVEEAVAEVRVMTKQYIVGLFLQIIIVSVLTIVVLSVLGVKYPILLGLLTGVLNVIPYIGIFTSMLISCFLAFATGTLSDCVYAALGYLFVHAIDGNIILPFVVGSKVKINALFSFVGIIVGESLWGISGMLLCIPAIAIIKIIFEKVHGLKPWGKLLGEDHKPNKKKRKYKISKRITLEEKD